MIVSRSGGQAAPRTGHVSSELRLIRIPGFERLSRFFAAVSRDPSSRFPSLHLLHQVSQFQFTGSTRSLPMFFSSSISRWKSNRVARLRKMAPRGEQGNPFSFPCVCMCVCVLDSHAWWDARSLKNFSPPTGWGYSFARRSGAFAFAEDGRFLGFIRGIYLRCRLSSLG